MAKYIFVLGGVVSGLGKGITAASLGRLLKARGYKVTLQKFDPYINIDAANISPKQHGEIYVTADGGEADLDLGHYERFIDEELAMLNDVTTGQIYSTVIAKERQRQFNGGTIQVIPHITDEIKCAIYRLAEQSSADIVITEIGGTVGDIESYPFLEAIRQIPYEVGRNNVAFLHVTLVPYIKSSGELKTKPTQHSVKSLQNSGIQPDIIVCRSDYPLDPSSTSKLAMFCNVDPDCVIQNLNVSNLLEVPLMLETQGLARIVERKLCLEPRQPDLTAWQEMTARAKRLDRNRNPIQIAIVGKYLDMYDAYLSCVEALKAAAVANDVSVAVKWVHAEEVTDQTAPQVFGDVSAVLVAPGWGTRGFDGKMAACKYARTTGLPLLGLGFGFQAAVVEFARNVCCVSDADSTEQDIECTEPIVFKPTPDHLRLGSFRTNIKPASVLAKIYGDETAPSERHRHKHELNPAYVELLERGGMVASGKREGEPYIDAVEIPNHPFFVGVSYHPEYKSRPTHPHPLFVAFVAAASRRT